MILIKHNNFSWIVLSWIVPFIVFKFILTLHLECKPISLLKIKWPKKLFSLIFSICSFLLSILLLLLISKNIKPIIMKHPKAFRIRFGIIGHWFDYCLLILLLTFRLLLKHNLLNLKRHKINNSNHIPPSFLLITLDKQLIRLLIPFLIMRLKWKISHNRT